MEIMFIWVLRCKCCYGHCDTSPDCTGVPYVCVVFTMHVEWNGYCLMVYVGC